MLDEGLSGYETAKKASQANTDAISAEATETSKSADSIYRGARITVVFALVGMLALCLLAAKALTDALSKPLVKAAAMLERVAAKDLTKQLDITGHDEVGQLSASLNRTIANMRDMLSQISDGTSTLVTATEEVTVSSHRASDNAQQQSMSVQMVATAAQELSSVISEISQNTSSASHASRTSAEDAHNGGRIVAATVQSIQSISSSSDSVLTKMAALRSRSEQIGSVVSVIREIADQTNLLALNASIESARAGEMGRGFAVVAGEVRRLAERTRTSTDEIGSLIDGIQGEVRDAFSAAEHGRADVATGLEHARQAGEALEKIIASARDAEGMVHLIAAAATEQASASAEISSNMGSISSSIEDSAAAAQQSSKTCKDLSHLAANLRLTVSEFSLS
jgi:methyl-accepting chemotaxis protein